MSLKNKLLIGLYFVSLSTFLVLIADTYVLVKKDDQDKIDHFSSFITNRGRNSFETPVLNTKSGISISLPENANVYLCDSCNLVIRRGLIFKNPVSVQIEKEGKISKYGTGLLNRTVGSKMVVLTIATLLVLLSVQIFLLKKVKDLMIYTTLLFVVYLVVYSV